MGEHLAIYRRPDTIGTGNCECRSFNAHICMWCGQYRYTLYRYALLHREEHPFCNKECAAAYNGGWPRDAFGPIGIEAAA